MDLWEIRKLSWRRFRVLFEGVFTWPNADEEQAPPARIADSVDWSQLQHRPVKDILSGVQTNKLPVGKSE